MINDFCVSLTSEHSLLNVLVRSLTLIFSSLDCLVAWCCALPPTDPEREDIEEEGRLAAVSPPSDTGMINNAIFESA